MKTLKFDSNWYKSDKNDNIYIIVKSIGYSWINISFLRIGINDKTQNENAYWGITIFGLKFYVGIAGIKKLPEENLFNGKKNNEQKKST